MAICARDIMEPHVVAVAPDMPLAELGDLLISKRISGVPVVEAGKLVGIVSRSDFVRCLSLGRALAELVAEGIESEEFAPGQAAALPALSQQLTKQFEGRSVRDIMVRDPVTVSPEAPITEVARVLVSRHLHRVLVVAGTTVHGIISALDVVRLVAEGQLRVP
jgi:predicted transcriptional regulator